jgi:hypothetical protein
MPRKPVDTRLISEHDVLGWLLQKSRPLLLSAFSPPPQVERRPRSVARVDLRPSFREQL